LVAAVTGLALLREQLIAAERGQGSADDVKGALQEYLDTHGPSIQAAASSVGDEIRRQVLAELYKWRASLEPSASPPISRPARGPAAP
jgi:hypothetical protein